MDWTGLRLTTPPTAEPVSLIEAKLHCRVDIEDEDSLIDSLIPAAREYCETFQRRAYITQTWQLVLDKWPSGRVIEVPRPPLQSVAITYTLADGVTTETLDSDDYVVDTASEPGRVVLKSDKSWPTDELKAAGGIVVEFVAGYGDAATDVPQRVKQAMLLLIGHWHANREQVVIGQPASQLPVAAEALLWPDRMVYA